MEVSVRELKNRLSEFLRKAQAGEEIDVLSRGRPVGRLVAPRPSPRATNAEALARLKTMPGLRPGNGNKVNGSDRRISVPAGTTDDVLDWVRGE